MPSRISATARCAVTVTALLIAAVAHASNPVGTMKGRVVDADDKQPLLAATIMLRGTSWGTTTGEKGTFVMENIPVGSYTVVCSYIGYETLVITDVVVRSQRITTLNLEMKVCLLETGEVTVTPGFFSGTDAQQPSMTTMSGEEVRRAPGSAGDVSRIIMALPGVAKVNDTRNSLVVRGGSPFENGYYIDNIPVPNINHFPLQGASSGALGLVNVDFLQDVRFYSGGFPATFGDRLSSITDLTLREGNRDEFDGQVDFNLMGVGVGLEGPLPKKGGSWLFSARRGYLDLLLNSFNVEASTIPEYGDVQGKVALDLSPRHRLVLLDLLGIDHSFIHQKQAEENRENFYGKGDWTTNAVGADWRCLWKSRGYTNTSLSHSISRWESRWQETLTGRTFSETRSTEHELALRNSSHWAVSSRSALEFGIEGRYLGADYDNFYAEDTDVLGHVTPALFQKNLFSSFKFGAHASYSHTLWRRLTLAGGLRFDYFDLSENAYASPRFQALWRISKTTALNAMCGRFRQFLPLILISQHEEFKQLDDPLADHYVLGVSQILTENMRLTVEGYLKEYRHLPLDPLQPSLYVMDESNTQDGYLSHERLTASGKAYTRGIEVMVQKKLMEKIYGIISGSWFRARYRGYDGVWRDRIVDNRFIMTIEGGYKPNPGWEFGMRWVFAGGAPYTPFDEAASTAARTGIYDQNRINDRRLPDYHTLNLRVDRRFHFRKTNLIVYLAVANIYGRENVAGYFWSEVDNAKGTMKQWSTLPIFGLEFEY